MGGVAFCLVAKWVLCMSCERGVRLVGWRLVREEYIRAAEEKLTPRGR